MAHESSAMFEYGSQWRRWNPHIHAPGTLLNDQFEDDWVGYLKAIEDATPVVEALGITDYHCLETYRAVKAYKDAARLPGVQLLFPNIECRLTIETDKVRPINLHLLFCPEDNDHIERIERALLHLSFEYQESKHHCRLIDLEALGKLHDRNISDAIAARRAGPNQFKVNMTDLRNMFRNDRWVADNCIVAVAASNNDGTAGLQKDAGFAATRKEIERFADVIFSSNLNSRDFWLGKSASVDVQKLLADYGGTKPCLHGCDAHSVAKTCKPDDNRFCWIKGDPTFDTLRHVLLEPEDRVWIGQHAPTRHDASQCISKVAP